MADSEPTIEELQSQLAELKSQYDRERDERARAEESLKEARRLNGKYLTQVLDTRTTSPMPEEVPHRETMEEFCDSFINAHKEQRMKLFGGILNGNSD